MKDNRLNEESDRVDAPTSSTSRSGVTSTAPRNIFNGVHLCVEKFHELSGRSTRLEYISLCLLHLIVVFCITALSGLYNFAERLHGATESRPGFWIAGLTCYFLFACVPTVCLTIRRLHDVNVTGHAAWLFLIPGVNVVLVLFLLLKKGTDGPNRFGAKPVYVDKKG